MKIIFVNRFFHPDHSATSQMLSGIAFGLAAAGHEVAVVTSRLHYSGGGAPLPAAERTNGVDIVRVWTSRFGRANLVGRAFDYASFYLTSAWALWRLTRAGDIVVGKTDPPMISIVSGWIARRRRARALNWIQDLFPEVAERLAGGGSGARRALFGMLTRLRNRSLRKASGSIVIGERMGELVASQGVPANRIANIPNWADGKLVRPVPHALNALRRDWQLDGAFVVGYSGNLGRAHDIATMAEAMEITARTDAEANATGAPLLRRIVWLMIGGGAGSEQLKEEVARRGLANVVFKPYQPAEVLAESLSASDLHLISLQPSLEGLIVPSKYYGIAAAGRPSVFIGDADGEIARILTSTATGYVVPEGDGQALARIVVDLARSDPARTDEMCARARRLFEERYDLPIALASWQRVLKALS